MSVAQDKQIMNLMFSFLVISKIDFPSSCISSFVLLELTCCWYCQAVTVCCVDWVSNGLFSPAFKCRFPYFFPRNCSYGWMANDFLHISFWSVPDYQSCMESFPCNWSLGLVKFKAGYNNSPYISTKVTPIHINSRPMATLVC